MLDAEEFNNILQQFDFGVTNIPAQSIHALKRATIELLRNSNDPEAVFLGTLLTDIQRLNNINIARLSMSVVNGQLILEANPNWVCFLEKLGTPYLVRELRHELTHLALMHPETLKLYTDKLTHCYVSIGMNICIHEYFKTLGAMASFRPLCPKCFYDSCKNNFSSPGAISPDKDCDICFGTGDLDISLNKVDAIYRKYKGGISRPYSNNAFDYMTYAKAVGSAAPAGAKDEENSPNIYDLAESLLDFPDNYSKAVVNSLVHHALSQSTGFTKGSGAGGGLLGMLKDLRREKGVPYLLQIKGVLGASMRDESTPTRFRPNRRFGYEYPGSKSLPKQRYVFAIDTSGSLPLNELKKMVNEFLNIRAYSDKVECRIIFFHHEVYYDKEVLDYADADLDAMQSGGTDFDAVLNAVFLDKTKERGETVLMIYTDGYCSINIPRHKLGKNIYWLLTPDGSTDYIKRWDREAKIIRTEKETASNGTEIFE